METQDNNYQNQNGNHTEHGNDGGREKSGSQEAKGFLGKIENFFIKIGEKLPHISVKSQESLVRWLPVLVIILILLSIPGIVAIFGLSFVGFLGGAKFGAIGIIAVILLVLAIVLQAVALSGLKNKTHFGWRMLLLSELVFVVSSIIDFSLFGIVISLIMIYLLVEIRSHYK